MNARTTTAATLALLALPVLLFAACSSDGAGASSPDAVAPPPIPSSAADDASADGGGAADAGAEDGAASTDAGTNETDGEAGPPSPAPPTGFVECGHGTVSGTDVASACATVSTTRPRACGAITSTGARYEVWCGANAVYAWAVLLGAHATTQCSLTYDGSVFTFPPPVDMSASDYEADVASRPALWGFADVQNGSDGTSTAASTTLSLDPMGDGKITFVFAGDTQCPDAPAVSPSVMGALTGSWTKP